MHEFKVGQTVRVVAPHLYLPLGATFEIEGFKQRDKENSYFSPYEFYITLTINGASMNWLPERFEPLLED